MNALGEKAVGFSAMERVRAFLFGRQRAYLQVFNQDSEFTKQVLSDLSKFCRANESTFHEDPRMHAVLEGRREVWLRIEAHLNLESEALWELYQRKGT